MTLFLQVCTLLVFVFVGAKNLERSPPFFYVLLYFLICQSMFRHCVKFVCFHKTQRRRGRGAAKTYERPGLSKEEIEEIREAFNLFDTDGSGNFLCVSPANEIYK